MPVMAEGWHVTHHTDGWALNSQAPPMCVAVLPLQEQEEAKALLREIKSLEEQVCAPPSTLGLVS